MRYHLTFCCLLAAFTLTAQTTEKTVNRWEVSASFAPDLRKRVEISGLQFEINPSDIPISQRPRGETLLINGQQRVFDNINVRGVKTKPTEADFWFGATIRAHRRFAQGFDVSAGLHFSRSTYTNQLEDELFLRERPGPPSTYIYSTEKASFQHAGVSLAGTYHVFGHKRLHPYLGLGLNALFSQSERELISRVYIGESSSELFTTGQPDTEPLENNILDFDFIAIAGILYQLNDQWSVGLEYNTITVTGPGRFNAQVRRAF